MSNHKNESIISVLDSIRQLLEQNHSQKALNFISHLGQSSASIKNAQGVCLLRLGKIEAAISVFREITFQSYICIPSDTPAVYQTNLATAMLIANEKESAISIISRLDEKQHPAVAKIRSAINKWEKNLNLFQKLLCKLSIYPDKAIPIDFTLGDLE